MNSDTIRYFLPKVKNRLWEERKRLWKNFNIERIALRGYKPFVDAVSLKYKLRELLGFYDNSLFDSISSTDRDVILTAADQAKRHEFDLLGSGPVKLDPINWHVDFKAGHQWEKKWYRDIVFIEGADIKVPWELSRCQHFLWLGEAYLLTGDEKYSKEIIDEINWWIDDNPFMYSVNWSCSMDVAFRAVDWMLSLNMISSSLYFNDCFTQKVSRSLWQHGFFIRNNLEKVIPYSNNHYTSDLVGLLYVGALFNTTLRGGKWFKYGLKEFYSEIRKQVLPSGVHYEKSVSYHRMMTEMLSYPIYMLQRIGLDVPKDILDRVDKMYAYVANYTKPNGLSPLIADNDNGRFAPFYPRDFRNHSYLNDSNSLENRFASVGCVPLYRETTISSRLYGDAGVAIMRGGNNYLFINNSGFSKLPSKNDEIIVTHTHNDQLSFELCLNGRDIFVDPGTFGYTASIVTRNEFRSTKKHNTVIVDNEEQNGFISAFVLKRNVGGQVIRQFDNTFEGEYNTISGALNHKRSFVLDESKLVITDVLKKEGIGHTAQAFFHFANGIMPYISNEGIIIDNEFNMFFSIPPKEIVIDDDTISPSYGVLNSGKVCIATFPFDSSMELKTTIQSLGANK